MTDRFQLLRRLEALLFASNAPQIPSELAKRLPEDSDLPGLLEELTGLYANRGINLVKVGDAYAFRTAPDVAEDLKFVATITRKLSKAAIEAMAIIAYHQPVTRAEIEEIRGVQLSKGTLDVLLEAEWIAPRGRRRSPGQPVTWGTTDGFLSHFGLESLEALPGIEELKAAGLLDPRPAVVALSERGDLGPVMSGEPERDPDEEAAAEELLAPDFGEDLIPGEEGENEAPPESA